MIAAERIQVLLVYYSRVEIHSHNIVLGRRQFKNRLNRWQLSNATTTGEHELASHAEYRISVHEHTLLLSSVLLCKFIYTEICC